MVESSPKAWSLKHEKGRRGGKLPYFELTISVRENARAAKKEKEGRSEKKEA